MFLGVWEKKYAKRTKTALGAVVASVNQKVACPCRRREPTAESKTSGSPVWTEHVSFNQDCLLVVVARQELQISITWENIPKTQEFRTQISTIGKTSACYPSILYIKVIWCLSVCLSVQVSILVSEPRRTDRIRFLKSRSLDGRGGRRRRMAAATILSRCDQRNLRAYWWWIVRAVSEHCLDQHGPFYFYFYFFVLFCFVLLFGGFVFCVCLSVRAVSGHCPGWHEPFFFFFLGFSFLCQLNCFRAQGGGGRVAGVA